MKSLLTPLLLIIFSLMPLATATATDINLHPKPTKSVTEVRIHTGQIENKHITLSYNDAVRTEQVLRDAQLQIAKHSLLNSPIYWLQAAIFTQPLEQKKQGLLDLLSAQQNNFKQADERFLALKKLHQFIASSHFARREKLSLDYDQARIQPSANPFLSGTLTLQLPARPHQVFVLGAVKNSGTVTWQERKSANDYLIQAEAISASDNNTAIVIQPDGRIENHPVAYWNSHNHAIAPGAIIYLPFAGWFSDFEQLNQTVVELLKERVL